MFVEWNCVVKGNLSEWSKRKKSKEEGGMGGNSVWLISSEKFADNV